MRYPDYMVNFYGIGRGPEEHEHLGCVSQMAVFVRRDFWKLTEEPVTEIELDLPPDLGTLDLNDSDSDGIYKLVYKLEIPESRDRRTREQRILDDGNYQLNFLRSQEERFYNNKKGVLEIPLNMLYENINGRKDYNEADLKYILCKDIHQLIIYFIFTNNLGLFYSPIPLLSVRKDILKSILLITKRMI